MSRRYYRFFLSVLQMSIYCHALLVVVHGFIGMVCAEKNLLPIRKEGRV